MALGDEIVADERPIGQRKIGTVIAIALLVLSSSAASAGWTQGWSEGPIRATRVVYDGRKVAEGEEISRRVVAILSKKGENRRLCGGVLISKTKVLTAGHCLAGRTSVTVYFGTDVEAPIASMAAARFVLHPQYEDGADHNVPQYDVGVIVLPQPAPADFLVTREYVTAFPKGAKALLAGYGQRDCRAPVVGRSKGLLFEILVTTWGTYKHEYLIKEDAGGTCGGDSGSPLFAIVNAKFRLVGIHAASLPPKDGDAVATGRGVRLGSPEIEPWFRQQMDGD